jgi:sortase A
MVTGVSLLLYPGLKEFYDDRQQSHLLEKWDQIAVGHAEEADYLPELSLESVRDMEQAFSGEKGTEQREASLETVVEESGQTKRNGKGATPDVIGVIEINKINVRLPILMGADDKALDKGAGFLEGTSYPGEIGNSAIAAHRSRTYGRMFNRLGEVKEGDEITIKTTEGTYHYVAFKKVIVQPNDLSVLKQNGDNKILTLITCEPIETATHRLIIQAKLKEK